MVAEPLPTPAPDAPAWLLASGLPERWPAGRAFTVVDTALGDGSRLQALRQALRSQAATGPCLAYWVFVDAAAAAPPSLPGGQPPGIEMHEMEGGRLRLYLAVGALPRLASERVAPADVFWLSDPARLPSDAVTALTRRRDPNARAVVAPGHEAQVLEALQAAGFSPQAEVGPSTLCRFVARPTRRLPVHDHRCQGLGPVPAMAQAPVSAPLGGRRVAVLGAGLAGCAVARSLADLGAEVHLIDRQAAPAQETSGNPAGLVHAVFHHPDTAHARLLRAAAAHAARDAALDRLTPTSQRGGHRLVQLQRDAEQPALEAALKASGWPSGRLRALDAAATAETTGLPAAALAASKVQAAWLFEDGGWLDPVALCQRWIQPEVAGHPPLHWHGQVTVQALEPAAQGWRLHFESSAADRQRALEDPFDAIVVAAAGASSRRLLAPHSDAAAWPLEAVRGQLAIWSGDTAGLRRPRVAVTGQGYAIPLPDGRVLVGATNQPGDDDARLRPEDARSLRDRAVQLGVLAKGPAGGGPSGAEPGWPEPQAGRAGVRWRTPDRLPIIGPVAAPVDRGRLDQCRFVPRVPGLYTFTALGSRGITWARFGADLLAAGMAGLPLPVESSLLDRVDPARFRAGLARRGSAPLPSPSRQPEGDRADARRPA